MLPGGTRGQRGARVRGRYMQLFAAHIDRLPRDDANAIRAAVPPSTWQTIDSAGVFGWIPIEVNLVCTRAVGQRLGEERAHEFFRTLLVDAARSPLLHGLLESAFRITVPDPGLYLAWLPKGYGLLFREAGTWTVPDRSPGYAVMMLRGAPEACLRDPFWITSVRGALSSLLDLRNLVGAVTLRSVDVAGSTAVFEGRWETR